MHDRKIQNRNLISYKKCQSGNPNGRPRRSKNRNTLFNQAIDWLVKNDFEIYKIFFKEGGMGKINNLLKNKNVPPFILLELRNMQKAIMKGDYRYSEIIRNCIYGKSSKMTEVTDVVHDINSDKVVDDFIKKYIENEE